jgi:hypothetical protein
MDFANLDRQLSEYPAMKLPTHQLLVYPARRYRDGKYWRKRSNERSMVTAKVGLLHYEREYVVRQVEIPAERAADFRKLESAILFNERVAVVLQRVQPLLGSKKGKD